MFGVQWTQANHDQFLISLYANLIANIITGILVGLAVWFIIAQIDKSRLRRQYEREIAEFREKLRFALGKIVTTSLISVATPPILAEILASELKEYPISVWRESVPKEKELFTAIATFQLAYAGFMTFAGNLQTLIQGGIRQFNEKQRAHIRVDFKDSYYEQYFLGKLLGMKDREILLWIGGHEDTLPILEKAYKETYDQEWWEKSRIVYQRFRNNLDQTIDNVKRLLQCF